MKNFLKKFLAITASLVIAIYNIISVSADVIIQNSNYVGIYNSDENPDAFVSVKTENFVLYAYYSDTYKAYIRGSTQSCSISNSEFSAYFASVSTCTSEGFYQNRTIVDFTAQGTVDVDSTLNPFHPIDKITITSRNNYPEKYIYIP